MTRYPYDVDKLCPVCGSRMQAHLMMLGWVLMCPTTRNGLHPQMLDWVTEKPQPYRKGATP